MAYNFKEVEEKWQKKWDEEGTFCAKNNYKLPKWTRTPCWTST